MREKFFVSRCKLEAKREKFSLKFHGIEGIFIKSIETFLPPLPPSSAFITRKECEWSVYGSLSNYETIHIYEGSISRYKWSKPTFGAPKIFNWSIISLNEVRGKTNFSCSKTRGGGEDEWWTRNYSKKNEARIPFTQQLSNQASGVCMMRKKRAREFVECSSVSFTLK